MQAPVAVLMVPTVIAGLSGVGRHVEPVVPLFRHDVRDERERRGRAAADSGMGLDAVRSCGRDRRDRRGVSALRHARGANRRRRSAAARSRGHAGRVAPRVLVRRCNRARSSCVRRRPSARRSRACSIRTSSMRACATSRGSRARSGSIFRRLQTGLVRGYALTIVIGAACFIAYFALLGGAK